MKKTLTLIAIGVLGAAMSTSALAQTPGPAGAQGTLGNHAGGAHRENGMKKIFATLNLTKDQQEKIKDLMKKHMDEVKELRKAGPGNVDKVKMKQVNENFRKNLFAILTPDQQKKFQEEMKKMRQEHKNDKAPGAGSAKIGG